MTRSNPGGDTENRSEEYPPFALRDYAFIADGERGALVGPRGDVAWLCIPTWDSDAVFSNLIGGSGTYAVTPLGRYTWGGYYDPRSLVWNSRWVTDTGTVESRDAFALPSDPGKAVLLRRIRVLNGKVRMRVVLDVRGGFGRSRMSRLCDVGGGVWTGRSGPVAFRWSGADLVGPRAGGPLDMELELAAGDTHDLVLELTDAELLGEPVAAHVAWDATHAAWRQTVPELDAAIVGRRDAELALAVLSGLTASSGGMSAAATMGLPERANAGRNYDYRYAWIRDQCYAGRAVAAHGPLSLLDTAVQFVSERLMADGPGLKPAYTVRGGSVPDERALTHLSGYPGGADIIGNQVNRQFQLDGFGEALQLFAAAASLDRLDTNHWPAVEAAAKAIEARWQDPDCGIWELDKQHWAHSRLTCAAGLRAMAAQLVSKRSAQWSSLADAIVADTAADSLHPDGRWQRSPGDDRVDAALLLPALRGALPRDDPRTLATLTAVEDQLVEDGYVYRFRQGTGPPGQDEGAFLLCGFILALARNQQGNLVGARAMFERNRAAGGSSGLLSEEFDVAQRQLRGNYPQAFVHAMLLECSATLAGDTHRGD